MRAATSVFAIIDRVTKIDPLSEMFFPSSSSSQASTAAPVAAEHKIAFHNVTFRYPSRPQIKGAHHIRRWFPNVESSFTHGHNHTAAVLNGLTLGFPRNKMTAIVGQSGSGKSTIVQLISRFYNIETGKEHLSIIR